MPIQSAPLSYAKAQAGKFSDKLGFKLIDVELVKESTGRFLRFIIDKDGGISLSDCELFHKQILPLMDKVDYDYMEVSSPGADRPLTTQADFERALGQKIEIKLYKPIDGTKRLVGELTGYENGAILYNDELGNSHSIHQKQAALVKPLIEFDEVDLLDEIETDIDGEGEKE